MTTKQAARGKWDGIIAQLIGEQAVTRKHGPCPICGGTDRYRYDNKRNDGDWFCNVCGPGDGFKLLQGALGLDFAACANKVDALVNNIEEKVFQPVMDTEKRRIKLNEAWLAATDPKVATNYLASRGIGKFILKDISDIRGHPCLPLFDGMKRVGEHPTMLALIRNSKGEPVSIHRTYLKYDPDGRTLTSKKIMPSMETIVGGAIRLGEPEKELCLAEGIETALAAWQITGVPAWATISAHGLKSIKSIPRHVERVIVCADNDKSFTGQAAAFAEANYLRNKMQIQAEVWMPTLDEMDMLDFLNDPRELDMLKWRGR
jgi:putative DNA primase/helicase